MPLHIKDPAAEAAVRRLAKLRGITLTEAVRVACEAAANENAPQGKETPEEERLRMEQWLDDFRLKHLGLRPGEYSEPLPNEFYDELSGDP